MNSSHLRLPFVLAVALLVPAAHSQASTAKLPIFDIVTIKPNHEGGNSYTLRDNDVNFKATNVTFKQLLLSAYHLKETQVAGLPGWAERMHFDVAAKTADPDMTVTGKLTPEQVGSMLQPMLCERFQLKSHTETKVLPVYELVVAKGGPKFKQSAADDHRNDMTTRNQEMTASSVRMESLAAALSSRVQRMVIDKTGLEGRYDFTLKWTRDDAPPSDAENDPPVLLTALQAQLILKLVPAKSPVPIFVIDHVEMPSEN